jgi:hypothetical protein
MLIKKQLGVISQVNKLVQEFIKLKVNQLEINKGLTTYIRDNITRGLEQPINSIIPNQGLGYKYLLS